MIVMGIIVVVALCVSVTVQCRHRTIRVHAQREDLNATEPDA